MKKVLSVFLSVIIVLSVMPLVFATDKEYSGICGENATFVFDEETGTLTISGSGAIMDFECEEDDNYNIIYESINIPWIFYREKIKKVIIDDEITKIGARAFYGCYNLESVVADGVEEIGMEAFGVSGIESVTFKSVKMVDLFAFFGCLNLREIQLPNAEYLNDGAFYSCPLLSEIKLPKIKEIGRNVFDNGCISLERVYLGKDLEKIEVDSFRLCCNLKEVYIYSRDVCIYDSFNYDVKFNDNYDKDIFMQWCKRTFYEGISRELGDQEGLKKAQEIDAVENVDMFTYSEENDCYFTFYCYEKSTAETYAKENGIPCQFLQEEKTNSTEFDWQTVAKSFIEFLIDIIKMIIEYIEK